MDINEKLLAAFQVEHVEHLEAIRSCLARTADEMGAVDVDEAFRRAHSLKGAARVTGLVPVETLAHQLESLFAQLRAKTLCADRDVLHVVDVALNAIEDAAACLLQGSPAPDASQTLGELDELLRASADQPPQAHARIEQTSKRKAADAAGPVASAGANASASDGASGIEPARPSVGHSPAAVETVRLSTESLDRLLQSTDQLLSENLRQDALTRDLGTIYQQLCIIEREWESLKLSTAGPLRRLSATPEMAGLAKYVELVEHEVHTLSRNLRAAHLLQQRSAWSVRLLAEQLQNDVRQARMVPVGSEFQGFRKMMRDLARDQAKQIEFRVTGFEVLADRMVLQALKDPLMHVLRNAVTHGIESPAERAGRRKPALGLVTLTIQVVGNRLTIEVADDGRGVDLRQVARTAVQRGLLAEEEAAAQSPTELTRLLFQPGFSTSHTVTELSGRGMGLSAVFEAVSHLQGEVELRPRPQAGVSLVVAVPLAISTHRLLLVFCRGQTLAIPFYGIEALHSISVHDVETIEGIPMVSLGGQLMPLTSLATLLDDRQPDTGLASEMLSVAVMRSGSKRIAVALDAFVAERNALIKTLGPPADSQASFMGGILLEDGSVSPVVNPSELVERFSPSKKTAPCLQARSQVPKETSTILVVDDSFTTRTLETSILETNGYQVRVAVDGVDALEQLRSEKIDLVISDIQMPRLDGFGLLEEIKRDRRLTKTPVIIVSSVDGAEDQERGLSLGADAYIVKRRFDHQELLKAVRQIL